MSNYQAFDSTPSAASQQLLARLRFTAGGGERRVQMDNILYRSGEWHRVSDGVAARMKRMPINDMSWKNSPIKGQLPPGEPLLFEIVSESEAKALVEHEAALARAVAEKAAEEQRRSLPPTGNEPGSVANPL